MSTWLTARELAGLPGMPGTEFGTRKKLAKLQIATRPRPGRGGGLEFECAALPEETRKALLVNKIAEAAPVQADAPTPASFLPPAPMAPNAPAQVPAVVEPQRRPPSKADTAVADARAVLVRALLELEPINGVKKSAALLALQLTSGACQPELLAMARTANQRARTAAVSARTLERWLGQYRASGWWGLLPAATDTLTSTEVGDDVAAVLGHYLSRDAQFRNLSRAAIEVTKQLGQPYDTWKQLYARARRALPKVDKIELIKARSTGAQRAAQLPFKRRDTSMLKPLDVWLIDGHTFKAKVRHPDHGAPFAPEVTLVIDAATRLVCGWSVSLSENVTAVGDALRHAVGQHGIPAIIYSDNGAGETAKQMDCPISGIVARLGSDHRTGIPGHPQGHGLIERSWRTHMINCARQFGSYQGKDVDAGTFRKAAAELAKEQRALKRAENTGEVIQLNTKAPSWKQFIDAVERMVGEYNQQHRHRALPKTEAGQRMTPAEAWASMLDIEQQHKLGQMELRMLFMPAMLRTAKRGEVTFLNQVYYSRDLMAVDGQQVQVRYDIHNPNFVLIFSLEGQYVCEATWNANRIDYFPKPVIEMAREKRVRTTVQRREAQIELAMRELGNTQDAANFITPFPIPAKASTEFVEVLAPSPALAPEAQATAPSRPFFDSGSERYEWLMHHRSDWAEADAAWLAEYVASDDYASLLDYFTGRGLVWVAGEVGFKSAR
nr:Mu transposase C-terminal domain-containing protein [uncultured Albidiferax sp.]